MYHLDNFQVNQHGELTTKEALVDEILELINHIKIQQFDTAFDPNIIRDLDINTLTSIRDELSKKATKGIDTDWLFSLTNS